MQTRPGRRISQIAFSTAVLALSSVVGTGSAYAQSCAHWTPERQLFFGDLHVHTALSFDAAGYGTRAGPRDAYAFARGDVIGLPPYDVLDAPTRTAQLPRPLDFAAVTDHAELLGETSLCVTGASQHPACDLFDAGFAGALFQVFGMSLNAAAPSRHPLCGVDGSLCLAEASIPWLAIQSAANEFGGPESECQFSTLVGYEWTAMPLGMTRHRNVLFRTDQVPTLPLSYVEASSPISLWNGLTSQCAAIGSGCEAITIPHNGNLSLGTSFVLSGPGGAPLDAATATLAQSMEPLVEIHQHKGDSECEPGGGTTDPTCDFEKLDLGGFFPSSTFSYARNALKRGLEIEDVLGVNPARLGLIASTDTHSGLAGATEEDGFVGHAGNGDDTLSERLRTTWGSFGPGGLVAVWAEENTRTAVFDALRRREVYATSGTRPLLRFFGGTDLPSGLCGSPTAISDADAQGVPMGGALDVVSTEPTMEFFVLAQQDLGAPGANGTKLDEIQLVKGWVDDQGTSHESVTTLATSGPHGPMPVDPINCETDGLGAATLCVEWSDPDFDPTERAFYYVRAFERPTCRWSTLQCVEAGVDCVVGAPAGLEACCDGSLPAFIRERATSSPIWVQPVPEAGLGSALALGTLGLVAATRRLAARAKRLDSGRLRVQTDSCLR